jgi:hypothetical protein
VTDSNAMTKNQSKGQTERKRERAKTTIIQMRVQVVFLFSCQDIGASASARLWIENVHRAIYKLKYSHAMQVLFINIFAFYEHFTGKSEITYCYVLEDLIYEINA